MKTSKNIKILVILLSFFFLATGRSFTQVLDVKKFVGKSYVERGEPVPVTIRLKGDQKKLCNSTGIAIILDVSGSLSYWHGEVKAAVEASLPLFNFGPDKIAIGVFAGGFTTIQNWTDKQNLIKAALKNIKSGGSTNLSNAIDGTNLLMKKMPSNTDCKAALIVTDGLASVPSKSLLNIAKTNGWKYFFLGVGNQNATNLSFMAKESGGIYLDTSKPPYSNSIQGSIKEAVDEFMKSAMKIVAPNNIVVTEVIASGINVVKVTSPSIPPNQKNPAAFKSAAATAWGTLKTTGKSTLPKIDKLDIDILGAKTEYSLDFEVSVNTCNDKNAIAYPIDGPGSQVTYSNSSGIVTVQIPNIQITVAPCDIPIQKTWIGDKQAISIEIKNNFSYTATEVELFEILNSPLEITKTDPLASSGGLNDSYARFNIPKMAPGSKFKANLWIKAGAPLSRLVGNKFQVNNLTDSYLSFNVPNFASELGPASPHNATLMSAIAAGVVGPAAKLVLEKAAFAVPHAKDTEIDKNQKILKNTSTVWPEFDWSAEGDEGTFLIKKVGSSYEIYVVHKKWKKLPKLYVDSDELKP